MLQAPCSCGWEGQQGSSGTSEQGFSHLGEPAASWASGQSCPHQAIMDTVGAGTADGGGEPSVPGLGLYGLGALTRT